MEGIIIRTCKSCNQPINQKNTKASDLTGRILCGICYLEWKRKERKEKGLK